MREVRVGRLLASGCRVWHRWISPLFPPACRFDPSCSLYAAEAFAWHGVIRGGLLAATRVARCHPWHPGGHDPVPAAAARSSRPRREEIVSG